MTIEGRKIDLRKIKDEDTDLIVKWRNNDRVYNNFVFSQELTPEMHREWLKEKVETGLVEQFIIIEKDSVKPVGSVYFRDIDRDKLEAEYGIFIGEDDAIGKGYGTEAAELALGYIFEDVQLKRVFLRVFEDNAAAIKSYKNVGFKRTNREEIVNKDGEEKKLIFMEIEKE